VIKHLRLACIYIDDHTISHMMYPTHIISFTRSFAKSAVSEPYPRALRGLTITSLLLYQLICIFAKVTSCKVSLCERM
jgi:hypothetical protein